MEERVRFFVANVLSPKNSKKGRRGGTIMTNGLREIDRKRQREREREKSGKEGRKERVERERSGREGEIFVANVRSPKKQQKDEG